MTSCALFKDYNIVMILRFLTLYYWILQALAEDASFEKAGRSNQPFGRPDYYDPCDYPRPSDADEFAQACGSSYLGSNIFCDPDHQFSRTETDALSGDMAQLNVSSCLCGHPTTLLAGAFEKCTSFYGAVLLARSASLDYKPEPITNWRTQNHRRNICQKLARSSGPLHERVKVQQMTKFAQDIVHLWREDSGCRLDLLLIVVNQWYPYVEKDTPRVIVYVSRQLQHHLRKHLDGGSSRREWPVTVHNIGHRPTDVFAGLKSITSSLTKGVFLSPVQNDQEATREDSSTTISTTVLSVALPEGSVFQSVGAAISMPDWAIILFIVCILMLPLCVLIGNVVSVVPSRRMNQAAPDQTSMRWAHKRWRAGFGGGFFGIRWKTQMTTAGDPATAALQTRAKPQSNNMMFRQFSKFKKPLKPAANSSGPEPRTASWTYV